MSLPVGAAEHDMLVAGVVQIVRVGARRRRVVANDQRRERIVADRIGIGILDVVRVPRRRPDRQEHTGSR